MSNNIRSTLRLAAVAMAIGLPFYAQAQALNDATIKATYKTDKAACDSLSGNAKDICTEQAKAKHEVAEAELKYQKSATEKNRLDIQKARAEGEYNVAKERCDDQAGNKKDVCVEEAKAAKTKAMADVKVVDKTAEARGDATKARTDAEHKVAVERCDSLSGDAKDACVKQAHARFGKS
jgi:hypothetical protein